MAVSWEQSDARLEKAARVLNKTGRAAASGPVRVGIDLGTADVVLMALDAEDEPVACFLEWAEVVRDGVVVDFMGAVNIVRDMLAKASKRLGVEIVEASTSFPPGTDARLSTNVLEMAGLEVRAVDDEPSCVAALLRLDKTAVVDIGGGTTGIAVVHGGEVLSCGDEPTGGTHISLAIAGHYGIDFAEAEKRKRQPEKYGILGLATPTLQRVSDIVARHIEGRDVERIVLTGGTCCLPGMDKVLHKELGLPVLLPSQPLLLTPLSIASLV